MSELTLSARFTAVVEKAKRVGVSPAQLNSLPSVKRLRADTERISCHKYRRRVHVYLLSAVGIAIVSVVLQWPFTIQQYAAMLFGFSNVDVSITSSV